MWARVVGVPAIAGAVALYVASGRAAWAMAVAVVVVLAVVWTVLFLGGIDAAFGAHPARDPAALARVAATTRGPLLAFAVAMAVGVGVALALALLR